MNLIEAIEIVERKIDRKTNGTDYEFEELNSSLIIQALILLIENARLSLNEEGWIEK